MTKMKYRKEIEKIENFIRERTGNLDGGIIGLSGGIDSTIIAYLSVRALGKAKVYGLIMPYDSQSVEDGELVAKELGIDYDIVNIKPVVDSFEEQAKYFDKDLSKGNLMARVRMCLLYGAANNKNRLVLGTTNKSEMEIGYFTKHGDGAVDIEPIAHLYKTEVWEMAEELGIPEQLITKAPSAELWDGQTDENELGFNYHTLDKILQGETEGIEQKVLERVENLRKGSWHKKKMPDRLEVEE
ncbi:MAG: NAD+ synthase [Nanoarchaeota archaeon]|nr:NAD+ synthase [Nanoarchaeota archaeon]